MSQPLISVIVPIYNVEKYVRKCLDSLKSQTFKQIEVICIDDGSTDNSGRIADEYMNEDGWPIFRVFHTENRGLSAARNRGIDEAKADWIMFVDSDDWVDNDFCRIPYEAAMENQADMVIFRSIRVKNGNEESELPEGYTGIVDELQADEFGWNAVWRRLYKRQLFRVIRYPEGRVYEDIAITHRLAHEANKILLIPDCLYYHLYRKDSISNTNIAKYKKDQTIAQMEKCVNLISYGISQEKIRPSVSSVALNYLIRNRDSEDPLYSKAAEIIDGVHGIPKELSIKNKMTLIVWKIDKGLFRFLQRLLAV